MKSPTHAHHIIPRFDWPVERNQNCVASKHFPRSHNGKAGVKCICRPLDWQNDGFIHPLNNNSGGNWCVPLPVLSDINDKRNFHSCTSLEHANIHYERYLDLGKTADLNSAILLGQNEIEGGFKWHDLNEEEKEAYRASHRKGGDSYYERTPEVKAKMSKTMTANAQSPDYINPAAKQVEYEGKLYPSRKSLAKYIGGMTKAKDTDGYVSGNILDEILDGTRKCENGKYQIRRKRQDGANNAMAKSITHNGVTYGTFKEFCKSLGVSSKIAHEILDGTRKCENGQVEYFNNQDGANNPSAKPITHNGVTYGSMIDMAKALGIPNGSLYYLKQVLEGKRKIIDGKVDMTSLRLISWKDGLDCKNPKAKPVTVHGIKYGSLTEASNKLNLTIYALKKLIDPKKQGSLESFFG
jgi:hypothetical protein